MAVREQRGEHVRCDMPRKQGRTAQARSLRQSGTRTEKLLWGILRARQVCGLKFRRQHPIGPFFADFACVSRKLVVEIDGGYHEEIVEADARREAFLRNEGWDIIRFPVEVVEEDPVAVAVGIAKHLGLDFQVCKRMGTGPGFAKAPAQNNDTLPPGGSRGTSGEGR